MVYKIGNVSDLEGIPITDSFTYDILHHYARVLTCEYGEKRNLDTDDGGFILYATPDTSTEDIKTFFDYTKHIVESVDRFGQLYAAMYILHNEFVVTIVGCINDIPTELTEHMEGR